MLTRFPGMKKISFMKRIILFNETFAPWGGRKKTIGVIWHKGKAGRCDEDLASAYAEIINHVDYRDYQHFIFWADNCAAQNKNWTLFSALVYEVNQIGNSIQSNNYKVT